MKSNWIRNVVVIVSLVCGTVCTTASADNKHGGSFGSSMHMMQGSGQSNVARSLNSQGLQNLGSGSPAFKTQIKTLGTSGGSLGLSHNNGISLNNIQKVNGAVLTQPHFNSDAVKKLNGAVLGNQLPFNPGIAKKINPAILGNKCVPGCNPGCNPGGCSPCKIGCNPWWWGCYSWCYPTYKVCYPVIYTQPIVIPISTPVVTEVSTVGAVVEEKLMQVPAGATLTLQALDLGLTAGQVVLHVDSLAMPAMVNEWKNDSVTATLPPMGVASPIRAELLIVKADGKVANTVKIELIAAQPENSNGAAATGAHP